MANRVAQQRQMSKDHFDNGTTGTLIPAWDVPYGSLRLNLLPPRLTRRITYNFTGVDLLPSAQNVMELQETMRWHITNILLDFFPSLRKRLYLENFKPRDILPIPIHKTEQYPLPAALIDESTIDGTLDVIDHIFFRTLGLDEEDIRKHGVFIAAGDQLTVSLIDSVSASRRDDTRLVDNPSKFVKPQIGLFHAKIAGCRCTANEHWGVPNSKSPWSLWRMNAHLARKPVKAGWKSKQLPPFRPMMELMLDLVLVANVVDGFCLVLEDEDQDLKLEDWVENVPDADHLDRVTRKVFDDLFSARRVEDLQQRKRRDVPLENIILFNRDALILLVLRAAVKRGDIGTVLNVLTHWMLLFRGCGKMPKYTDAIFSTLMDLKTMNTKLREAFLMNWLANLSGRFNSFKELDLLQEHQNFWLKVIYAARGSNRSWEWLAMISVSIFVLRDVIRQVQTNFRTTYNGKSHTSPSTTADISAIMAYLKDEKIQTYHPTRTNNEFATPVRDLFAAGASYANTAGAYQNFRRQEFKASYASAADFQQTVQPAEDEQEDDEDDGNFEGDLGNDPQLDLDDLALDQEEFPPDMDPEDFVNLVRDAMIAFSE